MASEPPTPPAPVDQVGSYQLTEIIGKPLPAIVMHQLNFGFRRVITSGQLSLTPPNDYTTEVSWREEDEQSGQAIAEGTDVGHGHYLRSSDSLHFNGETETSAETISALGPLMMLDGQLTLPELDAPLYSFVAKFENNRAAAAVPSFFGVALAEELTL
jgi:hypothetical protein